MESWSVMFPVGSSSMSMSWTWWSAPAPVAGGEGMEGGVEGRNLLEEVGEELESSLADLSNWCNWWHLSRLETGNSCCP